jgi:hypothetical protein
VAKGSGACANAEAEMSSVAARAIILVILDSSWNPSGNSRLSD